MLIKKLYAVGVEPTSSYFSMLSFPPIDALLTHIIIERCKQKLFRRLVERKASEEHTAFLTRD